jgi:chromosome segregation ATPase
LSETARLIEKLNARLKEGYDRYYRDTGHGVVAGSGHDMYQALTEATVVLTEQDTEIAALRERLAEVDQRVSNLMADTTDAARIGNEQWEKRVAAESRATAAERALAERDATIAEMEADKRTLVAYDAMLYGALTVPEVWSEEERDGMAAAFAKASEKHGHYESLFAAAAWLLRHRQAAVAAHIAAREGGR